MQWRSALDTPPAAGLRPGDRDDPVSFPLSVRGSVVDTEHGVRKLRPVFKFARRKADNDYGYDYVDDPVFVCVPS